MGKRFIAGPATTDLTFEEGSPLYGLEVTMRTSLGVADLVRLGATWQNRDPDEIEEAAQRLGRYLVAWNMEDPLEDGGSEPVPADESGWQSRDGVTQVLIFQKYMEAVNAGGGRVVDGPLSTASSNGSSSEAQPVMTGASY